MEKENFFCPQRYHLGPWWKQEANGCHGCIRNEFSKWVGTHQIIQLNGMSKIWQKQGFDPSQPYPKNYKKKYKKKGDMRASDHSEETVAPGGGGMTLHDKRTQRTDKQWRRRIFFAPKYIIWDPGGSKKQTDAIVASGMSFSKWVGTHEIL